MILCASCRFWKPDAEHDNKGGECRRYAPGRVPPEEAKTWHDYWCGDAEAMPSPAPTPAARPAAILFAVGDRVRLKADHAMSGTIKAISNGMLTVEPRIGAEYVGSFDRWERMPAAPAPAPEPPFQKGDRVLYVGCAPFLAGRDFTVDYCTMRGGEWAIYFDDGSWLERSSVVRAPAPAAEHRMVRAGLAARRGLKAGPWIRPHPANRAPERDALIHFYHADGSLHSAKARDVNWSLVSEYRVVHG